MNSENCRSNLPIATRGPVESNEWIASAIEIPAVSNRTDTSTFVWAISRSRHTHSLSVTRAVLVLTTDHWLLATDHWLLATDHWLLATDH